MGICPGECDDDDDDFFQNIWDVILPIDELIFFKMVIAPPTSDDIYIYMMIYDGILILYSYYTHIILIVYSYYTHIILILYSYYTHIILIRKQHKFKPIGSMVLLSMVTWIPSIYPSHASIYTSTMDPMGMGIFPGECHYCIVGTSIIKTLW